MQWHAIISTDFCLGAYRSAEHFCWPELGLGGLGWACLCVCGQLWVDELPFRLLAELSHVLVASVGITAGWAWCHEVTHLPVGCLASTFLKSTGSLMGETWSCYSITPSAFCRWDKSGGRPRSREMDFLMGKAAKSHYRGANKGRGQLVPFL